MADDQVKIDKQLFHNRLSAFIAQWKQDKRAANSAFNGADSVVVCIGKSEEAQTFNKVTAFQVGSLAFALVLPACLPACLSWCIRPGYDRLTCLSTVLASRL